MKKSKNHILLVLSFLLIFISGIQIFIPLEETKPLKGSFSDSPKPQFSGTNWFKEDFQQKSEAWLKENFGFRNFFVRLHHQISFKIFKKAHSSGVIVGKNNYLYEKFYIDALYGEDFKGVMYWEDKISKLTALSDSLGRLDKSFLILVAPSKAAFYEEHIPAYLKGEGGPYNYKYFTQRLSDETIPVIDFYSWFNSEKESAEYPLFPKTGIHWSEYGQYLAGDSIFKYLNSKGYHMPNMILDSLDVTMQPNKQDADIELAMNLLFTINKEELAYPKFHVIRKDTIKPRGIVIGDSFYWQFMADGMHKDFFNNGEFWYYNRDVIQRGGGKINQSLEYIEKRIDQTDLIVIICSEGGLSRFAWGFVDDLYSLYFDSNSYSPTLQRSIDNTKKAIKDDPSWLSKVTKKAQGKEISVDSMMTLDAIYMYEIQQLDLLKSPESK